MPSAHADLTPWPRRWQMHELCSFATAESMHASILGTMSVHDTVQSCARNMGMLCAQSLHARRRHVHTVIVC